MDKETNYTATDAVNQKVGDNSVQHQIDTSNQ